MGRGRKARVAVWAAAAFASAVGCSTSAPAPDPEASDPARECREIPIARFKELMIIDDAILSDRRSQNATSGAWSFRNLVEQMTPPGTPAEDFVRAWLESWRRPHSVNLYPVPMRTGVFRYLICPWLKRTPANACDAECNSCAAETLDLALAPFRLEAIVNRADLRRTIAGLPNGEGRFVFGVVDGVGDDPSARAMDMAIIFEYRHPETDGRDAKYWSERWHELASFDDFDEGYRAKLQAITDAFTSRGASPGSPSDSAIGQIRTNERIFADWPWQLREYRLEASGLVVAPTFNTPDASLNFSDQLTAFVRENRAAIEEGTHALPATLTAGHAEAGVKWQLLGVDDKLRRAFAKETCNGCHREEEPHLDGHFQISPLRRGLDKLSLFINNPQNPSSDDLGRRERVMQEGLCGF